MSEWLDVRDAEPALDGEDYGYRLESRDVLATDGRDVYVARFSRYRDHDGDGPGLTVERDWHIAGRDFYSLHGVTHWRPVPELPGEKTDNVQAWEPDGR